MPLRLELDVERLYAEHADGLFAFLTYRTGDRALAEDLLADAFERAYRARVRFDHRRASQKTWLYGIALNLVRDHHRRRAAEARAYERVGVGGGPDAPAADAFELVGERDRLGRALERLSSEEREVVALRYGADLTVPEIARLTRERLTTIEGRAHRGLRKLRAELEA